MSGSRRLGAWQGRRSERGSAVVETAIGVPAFMLFVGLIIFAGRTAIANQAVESAANDAARAASIARTETQAREDATRSATDSLNDQNVRCVDLQVQLDLDDFGTAPGTIGRVSATVSCRVDLSNLGVPGVAGTKTVRSTMSSPLDTYRMR